MALRLEPATTEDLPAIVDLWFTVFNDPVMSHMMPDTPGVRQWFSDTNRTDMLTKPYQKYLKVVDPSAEVAGRPRIVSYAKWDLSTASERGPRFAPWHAEQPGSDCDAFFGVMEENRKRLYGDRKNFCMCLALASGSRTNRVDLDMLATHPDYRRRGAGSMLIRWGCEVADREGAGAYIDASKAGAPLYAKHGFVDRSDPAVKGEIASMMRN